jgi:hypothetical protein
MNHDDALTDESGEEPKRGRTVGTAEDMISDGMNNPERGFGFQAVCSGLNECSTLSSNKCLSNSMH